LVEQKNWLPMPRKTPYEVDTKQRVFIILGLRSEVKESRGQVVGCFEFLRFLARSSPHENSDPYEDEECESPTTKLLGSKYRVGCRDKQDDA
jgi:hypothetical protein